MSKERLRELISACITKGEVTLSSGKKSNFYLDCRLVTLTTEGSRLVGESILEQVRELSITALGGPTVAACPMVSAAGVLADQAQVPLKLFYVRSAAKGHGLQKAIEGASLTAEDRVLVVDDVVTSGGSFARAIERIKAETPAKIVRAYCLVDRQEGGADRLSEAGVQLQPLFTREQLT